MIFYLFPFTFPVVFNCKTSPSFFWDTQDRWSQGVSLQCRVGLGSHQPRSKWRAPRFGIGECWFIVFQTRSFFSKLGCQILSWRQLLSQPFGEIFKMRQRDLKHKTPDRVSVRTPLNKKQLLDANRHFGRWNEENSTIGFRLRMYQYMDVTMYDIDFSAWSILKIEDVNVIWRKSTCILCSLATMLEWSDQRRSWGI